MFKIYILYDKPYSPFYTDTLPVELDIKLRVNRRDLTLPDTHGQIWLQLVSAFDRDPTLFSVERNVNKKGIEKSMLDILCLTSEARFPISRLVTLWRSERWRPRVTRWCRTSLGRTTFNISKWYQIAGYRLDDVSDSPLVSVDHGSSLFIVSSISSTPGQKRKKKNSLGHHQALPRTYC